MTRSSSSTACWRRPRRSSSPASRAEPWRPMPTANRAWMAPSCSSLAIRSRSSRTARRCSSPLEAGVLEGDRGLLGEGLDQLHGRLAERRTTSDVGDGQRAQGVAAHGQGDEQRRPDPGADDRLGHPVVGRGVGQGHRLAGAQHLAGHRPRRREGSSSELLGQQPVGGLDHQSVGSGGEGEGGQVGADQFPGVAHDQAEQLAGVGAGQDRGGDGPDRLQPPGAILRLLVQVRRSRWPPRPGWPAGPGPARRRRRSPRRRASRSDTGCRTPGRGR